MIKLWTGLRERFSCGGGGGGSLKLLVVISIM